MTGRLRTEEEIRAAGAEAVRGWQLTDKQVDLIAALLHPVREEVWRRIETPTVPAADAA